MEKARAKKDLPDPLFQEIFNPMGPASSMSKASEEIQLAVAYINLGISYSAHARDMRHHLAITSAEQAAISGTAEQWLFSGPREHHGYETWCPQH